MRITRTDTGKSITATVADECPVRFPYHLTHHRIDSDFFEQTCNSGQSLDLSVGAFTSLATESVGLFAMTWSFV